MSEATPEAPPEEAPPEEAQPEEVPAEESEESEQEAAADLGNGWLLVHDDPGGVVVLSETQGEARTQAPTLRAEKQLANGAKVEAQGESEEQLQERMDFIDTQTEASPPGGPLVLPVSGTIVPTYDNEGNQIGEEELPHESLETVITPEGNFTEAEWSQRHRTDTIVTADGQQVFSGVVEVVDEAEPAGGNEAEIEAMDTALQTIAADSAAAEQERTAEEPIESKQVVYDTADTVDSPGQSAGGTLVLPPEAESLAQASQQMAEASAEAENVKTADAQALPEAEAEAPPAEVNATEGAVTAAEELGVDLTTVEGTGAEGRIVKADVEAAAADAAPAG